MVKNEQLLRSFEHNYIKNSIPVSFKEALDIFTALWKEGMSLGVLPTESPLEGIETDIRIARVLNSCSKHSYPE